MALVLALSDSSVSRLHGWKVEHLVVFTEYQNIHSNELEQWRKMEEVMNPVGNFKNLRAFMSTVSAPLVPLSGLYPRLLCN